MTKHDFRFTPQDHERMKEALDKLSDNPTEEEAEAALQACGTSGKEVVNEFIERLLKENLELKQELARRAAVARPRGDALAELFDLFEKDERGRWCFKSLSRDDRKLDSVMDRLAAATASPAPAESDGAMTPEQLKRAGLIAESRGIDLEVAQELVYLRDARALGHLDGLREAEKLSSLTGAIRERIKLAEAELKGTK